MSDAASEVIRWSWYRPPGDAGGAPPWLREAAAFRARVLHDGGRRPAFASGDPVDPRDLRAHHLVATNEDAVVGCWRLLPLAGPVLSLCAEVYGEAPLNQALTGRDLAPDTVGEGGGWAVAPELRGRRLGLQLWAAGASLGERLGMQAIIAAMGTREGQAEALLATGAVAVPELGTPHVPELDDELLLGIFRPRDAAVRFRSVMDEMAERLEPRP